jgi:AcrR family transcriptional regulator
VWQHFEDLEALITEAGERDLERAQSFVADIDVALPLSERIARLVDQRVAMFEAMSPSWRAARLHAPFSATIRRNRDALMAIGRRQVEDVFAPELAATDDRDVLLDALEIACAWAPWESLRDDAHLDVERARSVMRRWVTALCSPPGAAG